MPVVKASAAMVSREFARNNPTLHIKDHFHRCHDILPNLNQIIVLHRILGEENILYHCTIVPADCLVQLGAGASLSPVVIKFWGGGYLNSIC